jgi:hypothetical protein
MIVKQVMRVSTRVNKKSQIKPFLKFPLRLNDAEQLDVNLCEPAKNAEKALNEVSNSSKVIVKNRGRKPKNAAETIQNSKTKISRWLWALQNERDPELRRSYQNRISAQRHRDIKKIEAIKYKRESTFLSKRIDVVITTLQEITSDEKRVQIIKHLAETLPETEFDGCEVTKEQLQSEEPPSQIPADDFSKIVHRYINYQSEPL